MALCSFRRAGAFALSVLFSMTTATLAADDNAAAHSRPHETDETHSAADASPQTDTKITAPEQEAPLSDSDLPRLITYIDSPIIEQRQVFTREDIDDMNADSLPELFEAAGVQVKSYGAYGNAAAPSIRGFTGSSVKVIIDGICVNSAQNGTFDFSAFDIGSIERLEISRGSFSEDASADGGAAVIYISTKKQSLGHHFHAAASAKTYFSNPFDTYAASLGYNGQLAESTFFNAGGKFVSAQNQFIFENAQGKSRLRKNNEVYDGSATAAVSHYFGDGNSLTVSEQFYGGNKHIPGPENSATVGIQQDFNNILSMSVNVPAAAKNCTIKSALGWISNNQFYETPSEDSRHMLNELTFSASATFTAADFFKESLGSQIQLAFLDSTDVGTATQFSGFVKSTSEFALGEIFSILIPLSLAFSNKNVAPIPKLGIRADFPHVSLFLNGSRLYLFPDMNQLYWKDSGTASGNPDLQPECGWGGEFAANVHGIWLPFSISFYTNYYSNKIQWQADGIKWTPQNVASAFYAGINVFAEKTLFGSLTLRAQYEYLYNRLLGEGATHGNKIMYTPEHVVSASATYRARFATVYVDAHYVGRRYLSNLNIGSLEPYLLLNASISFKPAKWITPYIKMNNILNADYEQSEGYPMPGISLESGIKCNW